MKKLITLILIAVIGFGAYRAIAPRIEQNRARSAIAGESSQEYIAENLLNGKFVSLISQEQLEKIVDRVKNSNLLAEDGPLRSFLEKQGLTPETFCEKLKDKTSLEKMRLQFTDFLTDQYCEEKGVSRGEVSQEELKSYQKEKVSGMVGDVLQKLKQAG